MTIDSLRKLNNGVFIPALGFGTYQSNPGPATEQAVRWALEAGYRHIDTAAYYRNEANVGKAVRESGVPRDDIFVTTKLAPQDFLFPRKAFEKSLRELNLGPIDLYLLHWPVSLIRNKAWKVLEQLYTEGKCRAIGVSNYTIRHLEELLKFAKVVPAVNQVEMSPFLYQKELIEYCNSHGIVVEAYSPLTRGMRLQDEKLVAVATKYKKTAAQILIRWALQHGLVPLPKSIHQERIQENAHVFDFEIANEDMEILDSLNESYRTCWDPTKMP